jgi:hypothetical protein
VKIHYESQEAERNRPVTQHRDMDGCTGGQNQGEAVPPKWDRAEEQKQMRAPAPEIPTLERLRQAEEQAKAEQKHQLERKLEQDRSH